MTVAELLPSITKTLEAAGIGTARLDCLILLEDILGVDRSSLLAHPETTLTTAQTTKVEKAIARRVNHEPLAFIRGRTEFYGRTFVINQHVLEPRPESETMIDMLKALPKLDGIADIGTGSGALAITAKLEIPQATVYGVDIDPKCLKVAKQNATLHKAAVNWLDGNLLEPFNDQILDALLCNLPYVPDDYHINQAALMEPRVAIFGGKDGLDHYRTLFGQLESRKQKPVVLTEALPFQHAALTALAKSSGYKLTKTDDFIQQFNFLESPRG